MLETYLLVVTLTFANGETLEAIGEEYPTYEECYRENKKEMEHIKADLKKQPTIIKDLEFRCERLSDEVIGVNFYE